MPIIDFTVFVLGNISGGYAVWHYKDKLEAWYHGADKFALALEAKAAALKAAVKK